MKSPEKTTAVAMAGAPSQSMDTPTSRKMRLVREVLRPYRGWIVIILLAMLVETAMSLAAPWPLKVILDNVVGTHKAPEWLDSIRNSLIGRQQTSTRRRGGHRNRTHCRLRGGRQLYRQLLHRKCRPVGGARSAHASLSTTCSTFRSATTTATRPARCFRPSPTISRRFRTSRRPSTLDILIDLLTIVGMLGLMFWLELDFALIAVGVSPFLLLFVARLQAGGQERDARGTAAPERHRRGGGAGAGIDAGGEGIRPTGARGERAYTTSARPRSTPRSRPGG